jgi:glutathione S-transferase
MRLPQFNHERPPQLRPAFLQQLRADAEFFFGDALLLSNGDLMTLTLHMHPLASFCHKVLIALYENGTPFEPYVVDLGDAAANAAFKTLWPMGNMPVLRDEARDRTVAETSIIIEYLDHHYPGAIRFIPADPELALQARFGDRFYDLYVQQPMQKIVTDRLRPAGENDHHGVGQARTLLQTAYGVIEHEMASRIWAAGEAFTIADCAAAPALFYANMVAPFGDTHHRIAAYFGRLSQRPSFARVLREAEPYFKLIPQEQGTAKG